MDASTCHDKVTRWTAIGDALADAHRTNAGEAIIEKLVDSGIIPCLIKLVKNAKCEPDNIVEQALFCLTNITMSTNEKYIDQIVETQDTINILVDLILSNNIEIADYAIWSLCNIVGTAIKHRNIVVKNERILNNLINVASKCMNQLNLIISQYIGHDLSDSSNKDEFYSKFFNTDNIENVLNDDKICGQLIVLPKRVAWMFRNFVRKGMNEIDIGIIEIIIDGIGLLIRVPDGEILDETIWATTLMTQSMNENIDIDRMVRRMIKNDILKGLMLCVEWNQL